MTNEEFIKSISLEGEIWKDVVGYEGYYMVSSYGRVISLSRIVTLNDGRTGTGFKKTLNAKILKQSTDYGGYLTVSLYCRERNIRNKTHKVHRLVAMAFVPNPQNLQEIDHIDRVRNNNCATNLRWCTTKENHQNILTQFVRATPVQQISLDGVVLRVFSSAKKAGRFVHVGPQKIISCCEGITNTCQGYKWQYLEYPQT